MSEEFERIDIGEPFPSRDQIPPGNYTGGYPLLVGDGVMFPIVVPELQDGDVEAIRRSPLTVGVSSVKDVPFIMLNFQGWMELDGTMNPFMYWPKDRKTFIEGTSNSLCICLLSGEERIVRAIRVVGLDPKVIGQLRTYYENCIEKHPDGESVNRAVAYVYRKNDSGELLSKADHTQKFVGQSLN